MRGHGQVDRAARRVHDRAAGPRRDSRARRGGRVEVRRSAAFSIGGLTGIWLGQHAPRSRASGSCSRTPPRALARARRWSARIATVRAEGMQKAASNAMTRWFTAGVSGAAAGSRRALRSDRELVPARELRWRVRGAARCGSAARSASHHGADAGDCRERGSVDDGCRRTLPARQHSERGNGGTRGSASLECGAHGRVLGAAHGVPE